MLGGPEVGSNRNGSPGLFEPRDRGDSLPVFKRIVQRQFGCAGGVLTSLIPVENFPINGTVLPCNLEHIWQTSIGDALQVLVALFLSIKPLFAACSQDC